MTGPCKSCPLCESGDIKSIGSHESYTLQCCGACAAQFWWPLKHPGQNYYEELVYRKGRLQWRQWQFLNNPPISQGRVLDIGTGLGNFLFAVQDKLPNLEPWGVDISTHFVDYMKKRGLKNVHAQDLAEFVLRTDIPKFDAVTMFEIIEHIESPRELISQIKKILAPGGRIIISTPNLDRVGGPFSGEDLPPHHFWMWHPKTLKSLLEREGFEVERIALEPLGKDFVWRQLHRLAIFNWIKGLFVKLATFAAHGRTTESVKEGKAQDTFSDPVPEKRLVLGNSLVIIKDVVATVLAIPFYVLGRIFGWNYWDMYVQARLKQ